MRCTRRIFTTSALAHVLALVIAVPNALAATAVHIETEGACPDRRQISEQLAGRVSVASESTGSDLWRARVRTQAATSTLTLHRPDGTWVLSRAITHRRCRDRTAALAVVIHGYMNALPKAGTSKRHARGATSTPGQLGVVTHHDLVEPVARRHVVSLAVSAGLRLWDNGDGYLEAGLGWRRPSAPWLVELSGTLAQSGPTRDDSGGTLALPDYQGLWWRARLSLAYRLETPLLWMQAGVGGGLFRARVIGLDVMGEAKSEDRIRPGLTAALVAGVRLGQEWSLRTSLQGDWVWVQSASSVNIDGGGEASPQAGVQLALGFEWQLGY